MAIDEEETFKKFGYRSTDPKKKTARVWAICKRCGKGREIFNNAYRDLCGSCAGKKRFEDYPITDELREKRRICMLKRYEDQKEREKTRITTLKRYEDSKEREKSRIRMLKRYEDPEEHEKTRITTLKQWEDPIVHDKMISGQIKRYQNKRWNRQVLNNFIDGEPIKDFIDAPKRYDWRDWDRSILLNDEFSGCGRHHVTEFIVICIPNEVHDFYKHCLATRRGMRAINKFSWKFLFGKF